MIAEQLVWVTLKFEDGSKRHLLTSTNKDVMANFGASVRDNALFDVNQMEYVELDSRIEDISWQVEKPCYKEELDEFISRFI